MQRFINADGEMVELSEEQAGPLPPLPNPVPLIISDRQFAQGLKARGIITHGQAMAFVKTGDFPDVLQAVVDQMPIEMREAVEITLAGATTFERTHPFTAAIAVEYGWSPEETDTFWRECAAFP